MPLNLHDIDDTIHSIAITDGGGSITVDGTVTTTINSEIAEDAAAGDAHVVSLIGMVRQDSLAIDTSTDGDASYAKVNAKGEQYMIDTDANALLTTIDTDTSALAGTVSGTELQVDIVASLPAGTNNIGDVDIASIAAGDNNIGNVDIVTMPGIYAEDSIAANLDSGMGMLAIRRDSDASDVADGDYTFLHVNDLGELKVSSKLDNTDSTVVVSVKNIDTTVGGVQLLVSEQLGRRWLMLQNHGTQSVWLKSGTGVTAGATGNGFELPGKSTIELNFGTGADLYGITSSSNSDITITEAAA